MGRSLSLIWHLICASVAADQRHERTPRGRAKVSINAVAVDPMRPYLFVTGSSDPLSESWIHHQASMLLNACKLLQDPMQ